MIAEAIYIGCAITSAGCAWLLFRGYAASRTPLLFWAGLCFVGLTLDNIMVYVDLVVETDVDLFYWRVVPASVGVAVLIWGLIREAR